jgi:hypothetical protein
LFKLKSGDAIKNVVGGTEVPWSTFPPTTLIRLYELLKNDSRSILIGDARNQRRFLASPTTINGGGERDRTDDPLLAKQVLSQLSYTPMCDGGSGWIRTNDPRLIKTVL